MRSFKILHWYFAAFRACSATKISSTDYSEHPTLTDADRMPLRRSSRPRTARKVAIEHRPAPMAQGDRRVLLCDPSTGEYPRTGRRGAPQVKLPFSAAEPVAETSPMLMRPLSCLPGWMPSNTYALKHSRLYSHMAE